MLRSLTAIAFAATLTAQAHASLVTFIGGDDGVSSLSQMTNSLAAAAAFNAAASGLSTIDFEGALPAGVTISGGSITNNSGCGALCGFNTTSGGQNFLSLFGGSTTFTFAAPVSAFGFYVTGLQTNLVPQETLTFLDGSSQTINAPSAINGGGAFIGFTDAGKSITSISYNATNDIVVIDDVRYGAAGAVPEATTWAMFLVGFGVLGATVRRKRAADALAA